MSELKLTKSNFENEVLESNIPVLVDFWAEWCGPCRRMTPIVQELSEDYTGRLKVGKVNVDEEQELAVRYQIQSIPAFIVFENGKAVRSTVGFQPKEALGNFALTVQQ